MQNNHPELFIISAPSGAGKSTLIRKLLSSNNNFELSVSATTRPPRDGEINGVDYQFISENEFTSLINKNAFIEYAKVHNHKYGTLKSYIDRKFIEGKSIILDIDVQGFMQIKESNISNTSIFILPPSFKVLKQRLEDRRSDTKEAIDKRMTNARKEIQCCDEYDFIIVNDEIDITMKALKEIIFEKRNDSDKNLIEKILIDMLSY
ncbi:guanylate kinase [Gammaproteobacteria bacterium]|nr:guanylate kinase [Gammaproteobacteria bacterium]MDB4591657.1 guanylate kinase [Gammaproteobacteria bacterium]